MPTENLRAVILLPAAALLFFAAVNFFSTLTPIAARNDSIDATLAKSGPLLTEQRLKLLGDLRLSQEKALARKPADPYAWSRLSYLRRITQGNETSAFDALRMSDLVSPYEAPQLPERAYMWGTFAAVQTPYQKTYQDSLWKKAYMLERDETWGLAASKGMTVQVGNALKRAAPELYSDWNSRAPSKP